LNGFHEKHVLLVSEPAEKADREERDVERYVETVCHGFTLSNERRDRHGEEFATVPQCSGAGRRMATESL
jgi:hypothetical protein